MFTSVNCKFEFIRWISLHKNIIVCPSSNKDGALLKVFKWQLHCTFMISLSQTSSICISLLFLVLILIVSSNYFQNIFDTCSEFGDVHLQSFPDLIVLPPTIFQLENERLVCLINFFSEF